MTKRDIHEFVHRMLKCYHRLLKVKGSRNESIMKDHMLTLKENGGLKRQRKSIKRKDMLQLDDKEESRKRSKYSSKSKSKAQRTSASTKYHKDTSSKKASKKSAKSKEKEHRRKTHRKKRGMKLPTDFTGNGQRMLYLLTGLAVGVSVGVILTRQMGKKDHSAK